MGAPVTPGSTLSPVTGAPVTSGSTSSPVTGAPVASGFTLSPVTGAPVASGFPTVTASMTSTTIQPTTSPTIIVAPLIRRLQQASIETVGSCNSDAFLPQNLDVGV